MKRLRILFKSGAELQLDKDTGDKFLSFYDGYITRIIDPEVEGCAVVFRLGGLRIVYDEVVATGVINIEEKESKNE